MAHIRNNIYCINLIIGTDGYFYVTYGRSYHRRSITAQSQNAAQLTAQKSIYARRKYAQLWINLSLRFATEFATEAHVWRSVGARLRLGQLHKSLFYKYKPFIHKCLQTAYTDQISVAPLCHGCQSLHRFGMSIVGIPALRRFSTGPNRPLYGRRIDDLHLEGSRGIEIGPTIVVVLTMWRAGAPIMTSNGKSRVSLGSNNAAGVSN